MKNIRIFLTALATYCTVNYASAEGGHPNLHINPKWSECSIQLDPSLTQEQWHQFVHEAGLVTYFRPLKDAKPMGKGRFEFSILQWQTAIDENQDAWNNTFVHPHAEHWLIGGDRLPFPGISLRAGLSRKVDVGAYWAMRPGANYSLAGAQVQYSIINDTAKNWAVAARLTLSTLYGPDDIDFGVCGLDLLVSKKFRTFSDKIFISPYAGVSSYNVAAHEKSEVVNLKNEYVSGSQAMLGVAADISFMRIGVEYNFARVSTLSYKIGAGFKF
jgi:hypothetical protein